MARTETSVIIEGRSFPYIGPHEGYAGVPAAELLFNSSGTILVAESGKDQGLNFQCFLPRGWAYVMVEANWVVNSVDAADWDDCWGCQVRDISAVALATFSANLNACNPSGETWTQGAGLSGKTYQVTNPLKKVILCSGSEDGRVYIAGVNKVIDGVVGTYEFYMRFLRFSLQQAHHFSVSTPVPVR